MFFKKKTKSASYISPELIASLEKDPGFTFDNLFANKVVSPNEAALVKGEGYTKEFSFVLIEIVESDSKQAAKVAASVMNQAMIDHMHASGFVLCYLVFYNELINPEKNSMRSRETFIKNILNKHPNEVRVLSGVANGYVTSLGTISPVGFIANAQQVVKALASIPLGSSRIWEPEKGQAHGADLNEC